MNTILWRSDKAPDSNGGWLKRWCSNGNHKTAISDWVPRPHRKWEVYIYSSRVALTLALLPIASILYYFKLCVIKVEILENVSSVPPPLPKSAHIHVILLEDVTGSQVAWHNMIILLQWTHKNLLAHYVLPQTNRPVCLLRPKYFLTFHADLKTNDIGSTLQVRLAMDGVWQSLAFCGLATHMYRGAMYIM